MSIVPTNKVEFLVYLGHSLRQDVNDGREYDYIDWPVSVSQHIILLSKPILTNELESCEISKSLDPLLWPLY